MKAAASRLSLFALQLVLNVAWSWIFFGLHQPGWAFVEIIMLWLAIVATTAAFFRCSKIAGWLLVPYLVWVSFASALNFTIWRMNMG
jgi:tryptophan-rich sensory protein